MFDQHVHSNYSIDSTESMENYIKHSKEKVITFTEHYDFNDPFNNFETVTFDIIGQRIEMDYLEEKYGVTLLQGIEIGYSKSAKEDIKKLLSSHTFDIVLLSVHHNDLYDYMMDIPGNDMEHLEEYFSLVEEALHQDYGADVLTHLDFGIRNRKVSLYDVTTLEDQIVRILQLLIEKSMSFEINSKGYSHYERVDLYEYFLDLYLELGGTDIVVNSDAHTVEFYQHNFETIYKMLLDLGINTLNYYKKRVKYTFSIKE